MMKPSSISSVGVSVGGGDDDHNDNDNKKKMAAGRKGQSSSSSSSSHHQVIIDIETLRLHVSSVVARLQSRVSFDTIRPLNVFLGIKETSGAAHDVIHSKTATSSSPSTSSASALRRCFSAQAFNAPIQTLDKTSMEKIQYRLQLNTSYFLSNYVLCASMVAIVVALMHPGMLLSVGLLYALWRFHSFLIKHELEFFGWPVNKFLGSIQQRFYVLFVITIVVVILACLIPTLIFLSISALLISTHAFLRDPKHITANSSSNEINPVSNSRDDSLLLSTSSVHSDDDSFRDAHHDIEGISNFQLTETSMTTTGSGGRADSFLTERTNRRAV